MPLLTSNLKYFFWKLLPAALWVLATYSRPFFIHPVCETLEAASQFSRCSQDFIPSIDRASLGSSDSVSEDASSFNQIFSAAFSLLFPFLSPWTSAKDCLVILQAVFWNGFATEVSHLIVQRPRPFVYQNPVEYGLNPAHYTSFYSGHTSFVTTAFFSVFFLIFRRKAPLPILIAVGVLAEVMMISTGYFRVLAGRHFLTDILAGSVMGTLIAWWTVYRSTSLKTDEKQP